MVELAAWAWLGKIDSHRRWKVKARVDAGDEIPGRIPRRRAVLVGTTSAPRWLALDCPCGRGHRLMINLDDTRHPSWRVVRHKPLTLRPSIDALHQGVRCHFVVTDGKIKWVPTRMEPPPGTAGGHHDRAR
jgi:Family of unknown function (DUF6527)